MTPRGASPVSQPIVWSSGKPALQLTPVKTDRKHPSRNATDQSLQDHAAGAGVKISVSILCRKQQQCRCCHQSHVNPAHPSWPPAQILSSLEMLFVFEQLITIDKSKLEHGWARYNNPPNRRKSDTSV
jgi:hypothetical protein